MKNKIEISEKEIRKAGESVNHTANFEFNTAWGPVVIKVVALKKLPSLGKKKLEQKIDEDTIIRENDNWIEELYGSLPIKEDTPDDFIKTIKTLRPLAVLISKTG